MEDTMTLLEKAKAELIDIIEWTDDSSDTMVWRFPRYDNEIKYGAQLIVRQSQSAVFVNTRNFTNPKWGTKNPVILRDTEF